MSYESDLLVSAGRWGPFSVWTHESLPPGTMALLRAPRIVKTSDVTSPLITTKQDANGLFTLRLTSSLLPPGMELQLQGVLFSVPMDLVSDALS